MEGLLSLLLIAGLFYLMMRFGCGAHMIHGHGGHSGHGHRDTQTFRDPVCGMAVAPDQGYAKVHDGREYRFCSRNCLDKFEADPERHLSSSGGGA